MSEIEPDSRETQALLERVAAGDDQARARLMERHRSRLHDFVDDHLDPQLRARLDASDVVQEAQMEATRRLPDYLQRRPMPFQVWLRKTAYERMLMLRRRHIDAARRTIRREVQLPDRSSLVLAQNLVDPSGSPSSRLDREELAQRMRQALHRLSPADREALLMRHYENMSYEEMGCILGIEPASARKRAGRALVRLHKTSPPRRASRRGSVCPAASAPGRHPAPRAAGPGSAATE
jgi:RNA polymerase sigma-70 factor (ECF subfamily)